MTFNPLSCGGRFCPFPPPRGFSIIVPKLFDIGVETFWSFYFRVLSQHFSKIVPAGGLLGPCNFGGGGLGWTFSAGIEIFWLLSASAERFRKYRLCRTLKPGSIISYHSWLCSHLTIVGIALIAGPRLSHIFSRCIKSFGHCQMGKTSTGMIGQIAYLLAHWDLMLSGDFTEITD